ncbi:centromere protein U [Rhynochetos jubatus]
MSSKKTTQRTHSGSTLREYKPKSRSRWKFLPPEEPDVSRILKVVEANDLEELDDSYDHPLHSTAVDAYGEEQAPNRSFGHVSTPERRNVDRSGGKRKNLHGSERPGGDAQKSRAADPEDELLQENVAKKKRRPSATNTSDPPVDSPCSVEVWCPKEMKRTSTDITELDVVLAAFEKAAANYRQSVESNVCREAISAFCSAFKAEITHRIAEVQQLKNTKKKNAKLITDIKKKREQLLQVRGELIRAESQLIQLQTEYTTVQERKSSLRQATELLTDLKDLQQDCWDYREENPKEKLVYGTSSLPALLVESRRIVGAERHFQNINRKLQQALDVQRKKLPEKH